MSRRRFLHLAAGAAVLPAVSRLAEVRLAEHEREMIADRTKAALGAAKSRGVRLGSHGADHLAPANHAAAMDRARLLAPVLLELKRGGMSARQIAAELSARQVLTMNGGKWHAQTVLWAMDRIGC